MTAVILTYLVLSIEPMVRCILRRISDAGIFYCSENSLQCYKESAEPTAERILRFRSMQPGAGDRLTRATHRAQHPVLRAGAGVSSPSTLFYPPTIPWVPGNKVTSNRVRLEIESECCRIHGYI